MSEPRLNDVIKCLVCDAELEKFKFYYERAETHYCFCSKQCSEKFDLCFDSNNLRDTCRHGIIILSEALPDNVGALVESILLKIIAVRDVSITPDSIFVSYCVSLPAIGCSDAEVLLINKAQKQQVSHMNNLLLDVELAIKDKWFERIPQQYIKCEKENEL